MLTMKTADTELTIDPDCGGAVTGWTRRGSPILHPVVDPKLIAQDGRAVALYPLIPFSNRIGNGRFAFDGAVYQLDANFGGEPNTIHGNGWMRAWTVEAHDQMQTVLSLEHLPPDDPAGQWPFRFAATLTYALRQDGLSVRLGCRNIDSRPQPVGLGVHPFFPRDADVELGFSAGSVWLTGDDNLPSRRIPATGEHEFQPMRALSGPPLDNCFAGWTGQAFLRWPKRGLGMSIRASEPLRHLVVFTPPDRDYLAVEPTSTMVDAVNHPEIDDSGMMVLAPGESLDVTVDLALIGL